MYFIYVIILFYACIFFYPIQILKCIITKLCLLKLWWSMIIKKVNYHKPSRHLMCENCLFALQSWHNFTPLSFCLKDEIWWNIRRDVWIKQRRMTNSRYIRIFLSKCFYCTFFCSVYAKRVKMLFNYKYGSHKYYEIKFILYLISYISSDIISYTL